MRKIFGVGLLALMMLCTASGEAQAQKSYSNGSRSSPSPVRSSPSPSPSVGKSYSSGSPSIGKSSSLPAAAPQGKSYSNGSAPPVKSSPPPAAGQPGTKYSNGSPPPATAPPAGSSNNSAKPAASKGWNPGLSAANQKEQSRQAFNPAPTPAPTYKSSSGVSKPLNPSAPQVTTVRNYVTHERYVTYEHRATVFYGPYYAHPVYYNDWYSPFLMGYMLSSAVNANDRAYWVYCHQRDMDDARYREMLAKDAELSARIRVLEAKNATRDPNFVLPGMADNPDLQYNHDFVKAAVNDQGPPPDAPGGYSNNGGSGGGGAGKFFFWFFVIVLALLAAAFVIWLVAIKEYK